MIAVSRVVAGTDRREHDAIRAERGVGSAGGVEAHERELLGEADEGEARRDELPVRLLRQSERLGVRPSRGAS